MTDRRRAMGGLLLLIGAALVMDSCCARRLGDLKPALGAELRATSEDAVTMQYLGTAGWIFRRGDAAIMTAPFYSNPGILQAGLATIEPDTEIIERFLPEVSDVSAILVGHAHYDHLMDVPWIARHRAREAKVYGSATMAHILAAVPELQGRVVALNDEAAGADEPGDWVVVADGRIRFQAIRSEHAPHYMRIKLYGGSLTEDLEKLPRRARGWKEGLTLSYVIEFLSAEGEPEFRIFYQDSATTPPVGHPSALMADGSIPFDAAILCGASFSQVKRHPEALVEVLEPRVVFVGHWEDFFVPRDGPLRVVRASNISRFMKRLNAAASEKTRTVLSKPDEIYALDVVR